MRGDTPTTSPAETGRSFRWVLILRMVFNAVISKRGVPRLRCARWFALRPNLGLTTECIAETTTQSVDCGRVDISSGDFEAILHVVSHDIPRATLCFDHFGPKREMARGKSPLHTSKYARLRLK